MCPCAHTHTHIQMNMLHEKSINKHRVKERSKSEDRTVEDERGGRLGSSQWLQKNVLRVSVVGCALVLVLLKCFQHILLAFKIGTQK